MRKYFLHMELNKINLENISHGVTILATSSTLQQFSKGFK